MNMGPHPAPGYRVRSRRFGMAYTQAQAYAKSLATENQRAEDLFFFAPHLSSEQLVVVVMPNHRLAPGVVQDLGRLDQRPHI